MTSRRYPLHSRDSPKVAMRHRSTWRVRANSLSSRLLRFRHAVDAFPKFHARSDRLGALASRRRRPAIFWRRKFTDAGGLMCYRATQRKHTSKSVSTWVEFSREPGIALSRTARSVDGHDLRMLRLRDDDGNTTADHRRGSSSCRLVVDACDPDAQHRATCRGWHRTIAPRGDTAHARLRAAEEEGAVRRRCKTASNRGSLPVAQRDQYREGNQVPHPQLWAQRGRHYAELGLRKCGPRPRRDRHQSNARNPRAPVGGGPRRWRDRPDGGQRAAAQMARAADHDLCEDPGRHKDHLVRRRRPIRAIAGLRRI